MSWLDRRGSVPNPLASHEATLRDLVAHHPVAVLMTNDGGRVLAASPAASRLIGTADNAPAADPAESAADPDAFRRRVADIIVATRPVASELVAFADGRVLERDYVPVVLPGTGVVHLWEYRDVTTRVRDERLQHEVASRLQFLVNVGGTVLYSCRPNADHDRTFVSDNVREMLGYSAGRWSEPGFWRRALHPEDAARVLSSMTALRERGQQVIDYRLRHENGSLVRVRDEMRLVCDSDTRPLEIVGWLTDVTGERRAAAGRAQRSASEVAHDFSNLLLVIAGHAHLLKGCIPAEDPVRWHVNEIAAAAERASILTDQMRGATDERKAVPAPSPAVVTSARGTGETVLVVEDEDAVRVFTGRALSGRGYRVLEARRAEEALEIAARYGTVIRAVVTDVCMPGMSGCELAERLSAAQPSIKVLLISGYDRELLSSRPAAEVESLHFLQKPFTPDVLATRLRQVLDN